MIGTTSTKAENFSELNAKTSSENSVPLPRYRKNRSYFTPL